MRDLLGEAEQVLAKCRNADHLSSYSEHLDTIGDALAAFRDRLSGPGGAVENELLEWLRQELGAARNPDRACRHHILTAQEYARRLA